MILPFTVVVHHFDNAAEDAYGNPGRTQTGTNTYPAMLDLASTAESTGETQVTDMWNLILPAGAVIDAGDEFTEGGRRFRVEGSPQVWPSTGGLIGHVEAIGRYVGGVS